METTKYPHLFSPLKVNSMILKNRIISAPLGSLTDKSLSGIGMIIRGTVGCVDGPRMRAMPGGFYLDNPKQTKEIQDQIAIIRQRGAKASIELGHAGFRAYIEKGDYAIGPCSFIRDDGVEVKAMDEAMMEDVCRQYASAAKKFKSIGFDEIMLHYANGWLMTQFLSPVWNKREDAYGGCIENRIRFPKMVVQAVREAVGPDYPLDMRITIEEYKEGGNTPEDVLYFLKEIEPYIDMVSLTSGIFPEPQGRIKNITPAYEPHLVNVKYSEMVKKHLHIPVSVVGAIMTPEEAEMILAQGKADAIVIGRSIIADPFWVKKAWEGRSEDIVPCIRCMKCNEPSCTVGLRYNREGRIPVKLKKAEVKKKVVIVGGGPAGMKAALTGAERGHEVILFEKSDALGGLIKCADYEDIKIDLKRYKDYLIRQVNKASIDVRLHTEATPELIEMERPDTLILAMGAEPVEPPIKGIHASHVMQAVDAYPNMDKIGEYVAIIGGGTVGCELALELGRKNHQVCVVEISDQFDASNQKYMRLCLQNKLAELDTVTLMSETMCTEIKEKSIVIQSHGEQSEIKADTVILAAGFKPNSDYAYSFFHIVQDTNIIGDLVRPASLEEALLDGYQVCAKL